MIFLFNGQEPENTNWLITNISVKVYLDRVKLTWTNPTPASPGFSRVLVVRCTKGYSLGPADPRNTVVYTGTAEECEDVTVNPLEVYYYTLYGIDDTGVGVDDPTKYLWAWDTGANSWGPGDIPPIAGYPSPLEAAWGPYPVRVPAIGGAGGDWRGIVYDIGWLTPGSPLAGAYWSWDYTTNVYVVSKRQTFGSDNNQMGYLELIYGEAD